MHLLLLSLTVCEPALSTVTNMPRSISGSGFDTARVAQVSFRQQKYAVRVGHPDLLRSGDRLDEVHARLGAASSEHAVGALSGPQKAQRSGRYAADHSGGYNPPDHRLPQWGSVRAATTSPAPWTACRSDKSQLVNGRRGDGRDRSARPMQ